MRKYLFALMIAVACSTMACDNHPQPNQDAFSFSGTVSTNNAATSRKKLDIQPFQAFGLAIHANVWLIPSDNFGVEVEGSERDIQQLSTAVKDGKWTIKFKEKNRRHDKMDIYISLPELEAASISGSGNVTSQGTFSGLDDVNLSISGSGNMALEMHAKAVKASISGSGNIELSGSADDLNISISGSGDTKCASCNTKNCNISIAGSGSCWVDASQSLNVRIAGSGDVYYKGSPQIESKIAGSGKVVKG
ncbi:MAG TPA: head GIN domain-containing protein [Saprospiraceae bacterium]|nr:head GIN domain-containing protein [Saprospiraceae bacterium]HMQ83547.1 head GIN domain-containing protein [Saprospiraceae bacterium]